MSRPQTIQIFLPSGDPQGMRIAAVPTRTVQVFEVPRKLLPEFLARREARQVGVYYLVGNDEQDNPIAYIGQSGDLSKRLKRHNDEKPFWNRVFVAVSLTNEWSQTHITYLEWESIRQAREAARMPLENGNAGSLPHTPEPLLADCQEYLETVKLLLSTLSFPLLDRAKRGTSADSDDGLRVFLKGRSCEARGVYSTQGLLVLQGSRGRVREPDPASSYVGSSRVKIQELADEGVLQLLPDGSTRFLRDHLFNTPSGAAATLYCSTANGRVEWRDHHGKTIADIEAEALGTTDGNED